MSAPVSLARQITNLARRVTSVERASQTLYRNFEAADGSIVDVETALQAALDAFSRSDEAQDQAIEARAAADAAYRYFPRQAWDLAAGGAQTRPLSHTAVAGSEHVYLNGIEQNQGVDWTRTGYVLSVLSAMDARANDRLEIRYAATDDRPLELNAPFGSDWLYTLATWDPACLAFAYDDSGWALGTGIVAVTGHPALGPFTDGSSGIVGSSAGVGTEVAGSILGKSLVLRRKFPPGTGIAITVDVANYCELYVDGVMVSNASPDRRLAYTTLVGTKTSEFIVTLRVYSDTGTTWGSADVAVTGTAL